MHAGMLEDRSPEGWARWRTGMRELAACPNVFVKLSGLGTFEHRCAVDLWRPVIEETLGMFGAPRCMFGSNVPVETLWARYADIVAVIGECLSGLSESERTMVCHDTAARVYHLGRSGREAPST
jgi:predicted TIM-barrel fold metal-dependent hydrolase